MSSSKEVVEEAKEEEVEAPGDKAEGDDGRGGLSVSEVLYLLDMEGGGGLCFCDMHQEAAQKKKSDDEERRNMQ